MPIIKIDDYEVSGGNPGHMTMALKKRYWELHDLPVYRLDVDYD